MVGHAAVIGASRRRIVISPRLNRSTVLSHWLSERSYRKRAGRSPPFGRHQNLTLWSRFLWLPPPSPTGPRHPSFSRSPFPASVCSFLMVRARSTMSGNVRLAPHGVASSGSLSIPGTTLISSSPIEVIALYPSAWSVRVAAASVLALPGVELLVPFLPMRPSSRSERERAGVELLEIYPLSEPARAVEWDLPRRVDPTRPRGVP